MSDEEKKFDDVDSSPAVNVGTSPFFVCLSSLVAISRSISLLKSYRNLCQISP